MRGLRWRSHTDEAISLVSSLLDVEPQVVSTLLSRRTSDNYFQFPLPKRSGGTRQVMAPRRDLRQVQRRISNYLASCHVPSPSAHGFIRGRSIVSGAGSHVKQRWVFNIDLADFFPSIHIGRVHGVLMAPPLSLPKAAASVLASLICCDGRLPIGAPSSPAVSNLIAHRLDHAMELLAIDHGCRYSRYVDDLTFSTNAEVFPDAVASFSGGMWGAGPQLNRQVAQHGFVINHSKVRMQGPGVQQTVTGLVVNEKANVDRRYLRQIRGAMHAWHRYGLERANQSFTTVVGSDGVASLDHVLVGRLAFVSMVRGSEDPLVQDLWAQYRGLVDCGDRFAYRDVRIDPRYDRYWAEPAKWSEGQLAQLRERHGLSWWRWPSKSLVEQPSSPSNEWLSQVLARAEHLHGDLRLASHWPVTFQERDLSLWLSGDRSHVRVWAGDKRLRVGCVASFNPLNWDVYFRDHPMARLALGLGIALFLDVSLGLHRQERPPDAEALRQLAEAETPAGGGALSLKLVRTPSSSTPAHPARFPEIHRVRGHIRTLSDGHQPSAESLERAPAQLRSLMGPNDTFVVPHVRGHDRIRGIIFQRLRSTTNIGEALRSLNVGDG